MSKGSIRVTKSPRVTSGATGGSTSSTSTTSSGSGVSFKEYISPGGAVAQSLSERFANFIPVPIELKPDFSGDLADSGLVEPVKPNSVTYLPMQIELLKPKFDIDLDSLLSTNRDIELEAASSGAVGPDLVSSDNLVEAAKDYLTVYETMDFVPALIFYINPTDLTRSKQKRSNSQFAGMGHVTEHWGNDQDKLSANGKIGATYTNKTGLTRYFRRNSASFQQLMHLYLIYRNNGYIYEIGDPRRISLVGRVQITYDTETWIGHFDSFSMTENADNPYTMEYSFEFTAREYYNDESMR